MANDIDVGTIIEEIVEVPVPQPITVTSASISWGDSGQTTVQSGYTLWQTLFVVMADMNIDATSYPNRPNYHYGFISTALDEYPSYQGGERYWLIA